MQPKLEAKIDSFMNQLFEYTDHGGRFIRDIIVWGFIFIVGAPVMIVTMIVASPVTLLGWLIKKYGWSVPKI